MIGIITKLIGLIFAGLLLMLIVTVDHRAQCAVDPQGKTLVEFVNDSKYDLTFFIDGEEKCLLHPKTRSEDWAVEPGEHRLAAKAIISGIPFLIIVTNEVPRGHVCTWTVADEDEKRFTLLISPGSETNADKHHPSAQKFDSKKEYKMNRELKKEEWKEFFETLSKRRYQWKTQIEVLGPDLGDQMLEGGLRFNGITIENKGGTSILHVSVGETTDVHQTHRITDPWKIAFLDADQSHGDIVEIEQLDGTKTLITFVESKGFIMEFAEFGGVAAVF